MNENFTNIKVDRGEERSGMWIVYYRFADCKSTVKAWNGLGM